MLELIDPESTRPVDLDGTVFHFKQLSVGQFYSLVRRIKEHDAGDYDGFLAILAEGIERVEGFDMAPVEVLKRIPARNADVIGRLVEAFYDPLGPLDRKNSSPSPDSSTTSPAGTPTASDVDGNIA